MYACLNTYILHLLPEVGRPFLHMVLKENIAIWAPCCGLLANWGYAVPICNHPYFSIDPFIHENIPPPLPLSEKTEPCPKSRCGVPIE